MVGGTGTGGAAAAASPVAITAVAAPTAAAKNPLRSIVMIDSFRVGKRCLPRSGYR
jgi:hypothetical protein